MKILITGKNSNIGNRIQSWIKSKDVNGDIHIEQLDVVSDKWKQFDFSGFDTIIHVAAIVHQPKCKDWDLYYKVNTVLPEQIALLAKSQGVKHFIFLSTMAVYGIGKVLTTNNITSNTIPYPDGMYGKSKYMAESALKKVENDDFRLSIIRPPNVYSPGGRGGYVEKFDKYMRFLPIIPSAYTDVTQSMIYVDNLCELVRQIVLQKRSGIFMPQDAEPISTVGLLKTISEIHGWRRPESKLLGMLVKPFRIIPLITKIYGGIAYANELSEFEGIEYRVKTTKEGLTETLIK